MSEEKPSVSETDLESGSSVDYYSYFSPMLQSAQAIYGIGSYTLYDLDQDGIKELITSTGTNKLDWKNEVYAIQDGNVLLIGSFDLPVTLYVTENGIGVYAMYSHMGGEIIFKVDKNGNELLTEKIGERPVPAEKITL